jgi:hypothetical protein
MATQPRFPAAPVRAGMYESFFIRLVSPDEPVGVWIRHTVHKPPGGPPRGSVWCTVFDARLGSPYMCKLSDQQLSTPNGGWIAVGDSVIEPGRAHGQCGEARWSLSFASDHPELHHLSPAWLYRAPLPRTKLTSPAPHANFDGVVELAGREPLEVRGWPGMVGHNWGSQHAERWIWLHGVAFQDAPRAWLDVALGRVKIGRHTTAWRASGALFFEGRRHRLGSLSARSTRVEDANPHGCSVELSGADGLSVAADAIVPARTAAGWRYADPDGAGHDVVNCSIAVVELAVTPHPGASVVRLRSQHGGAYELGVRTLKGTGERDHGVAIAPFPDGC